MDNIIYKTNTYNNKMKYNELSEKVDKVRSTKYANNTTTDNSNIIANPDFFFRKGISY